MKSFKKCLAFILAACFVLSLAACAGAGGTDLSGESGGTVLPKDRIDSGVYNFSEAISGVGGEWYADSASVEGKGSAEPAEGQQVVRPAGLITAAAWNENVNYDFWRSLFVKGQTEEEDGKFVSYYEGDRWGFDSTQRVKVTVKQGETPVCGATVTCLDESGNQRFVAKTGADGIAYLFPEVNAGTVKVKSGEYSAETTFETATAELEVQLNGAEEKQNKIQLMLVVDVTGSMGDELTYLQTELEDVIRRVVEANEGVEIDLALLFYRDDFDAEKFAYHEFTNVNSFEGLNAQLKNLRGQRAYGGDDTPEAVDEALELAMSKGWRDDNSTKIIFHVLDAPPHSDSHDSQRNYEKRFETAVRTAAEKGIRLCPVLCSGADSLCEYLMRQEAVYTGGTFIFVTDDSGIGGQHLDPNIPDAVVERLNDLMVRIVDGYHTGSFAEPVAWKENEQKTDQ